MEHLLSALRRAGIAGPSYRVEEAAFIPDEKGAYVLAMRFDAALDVQPGKAGPVRLPPGWLAYCGSANGPGGLGARLRRHFRPDKKPHWHVDRLTVRAADIACVAVAGGSECELVARLSRSPAFEIAVPGFGNTDCSICASHLLRLRE